MHRYTPHQLLHLPHLIASRLAPIYTTSGLRSFAVGSLGIFIPIYILRLLQVQFPGISLSLQLTGVFLYFALMRVTILLSTIPASRFLSRFGVRASIVIGNTLLLFHLLALVFAEDYFYLLLPASILVGILVPFYWIPYHLVFVEEGSRKRFGHEIGGIRVVEQIAGALAPLFGGFVIISFGFSTLLLCSLILVFISTLPSFFLAEHVLKLKHPSLGIVRDFFERRFRKSVFSFFGAGAENAVEGIVWPLFFFLAIESYLTLGFLTSVVFFISLLTCWIAGIFADTKKNINIFRIGSILHAALWIAKALTRSLGALFGLDIVSQLSQNFMWMPFDVMVYQEALQYEPFEYLILRELAISFAHLMTILFLAGALTLGFPLQTGFFVAAVGALCVLL